MKTVEEILDDMGIEYKIVNHEPALNTEMADKFIEGHIGVRTKTLFLYNKKKNRFFMAILDDKYKLNLNRIKEIANERMKFVSEEFLKTKLNLVPGVVTPLGVINTKDNDIEFYFDDEMVKEEILTFHPNVNTKTLFIKTKDLFKFLENMGYKDKIHILNLKEN